MTNLPQGDVRLLDEPLARELLASRIPARLAFVWPDGTPRVIPTWFHWNGTEVVMAAYVSGPHIRHPAARLAALRHHPAVALTIDTETLPPAGLTIRGEARIVEVDGLAPEYVAAAHRYLGDGAEEMLAANDLPGSRQARIVVTPAWVSLVDFTTRLPSPLGGVPAPA